MNYESCDRAIVRMRTIFLPQFSSRQFSSLHTSNGAT
jgi:hypothetical protein